MMVVSASHAMRFAFRPGMSNPKSRGDRPFVIFRLGRGNMASSSAYECDLPAWRPDDADTFRGETLVRSAAQSQAKIVEAVRHGFGGNDGALLRLDVASRHPVQDQRQKGDHQRCERNPVAVFHNVPLSHRRDQSTTSLHLQEVAA